MGSTKPGATAAEEPPEPRRSLLGAEDQGELVGRPPGAGSGLQEPAASNKPSRGRRAPPEAAHQTMTRQAPCLPTAEPHGAATTVERRHQGVAAGRTRLCEGSNGVATVPAAHPERGTVMLKVVHSFNVNSHICGRKC
jgi:hypothetical protein